MKSGRGSERDRIIDYASACTHNLKKIDVLRVYCGGASVKAVKGEVSLLYYISISDKARERERERVEKGGEDG